jgi:hypothetical protein
MKKIIRTPGIIAVLLVMLFACNEDFLNRPGQGSLDANVLANQDGVEANLITENGVPLPATGSSAA